MTFLTLHHDRKIDPPAKPIAWSIVNSEGSEVERVTLPPNALLIAAHQPASGAKKAARTSNYFDLHLMTIEFHPFLRPAHRDQAAPWGVSCTLSPQGAHTLSIAIDTRFIRFGARGGE